MRAIYKAPGKDPQIVETTRIFEILKQIVGGTVTEQKISDNAALLFDAEGERFERKPNFYLGAIAEVIYGPVLVVGVNGDEFDTLPDDEAEEISRIMRGGFEI